MKQRSSPTAVDNSCTTFMKNYVDRLKRERKRQNKKHSLNNKEKKSHELGVNVPLCGINQTDQILILERVGLPSK